MIYDNTKLLNEPTRLKYYILSIYREVLLNSPVGTKRREVTMKRFDYLKNQPDYYWTSFIEI
tara:strand:+ start:597 stop:782 length:186 start_codon:yes stop_codon:yes gene_type:complete